MDRESWRLRAEGRLVELTLGPAKLKRILAEASKEGAERIWLVGEDEVARGVVKVRTLETREEHEEPL